MSDMKDGTRFVWLDLETTGLNVMTDLILEIGVRITDGYLNEIDVFDVQIWDSPLYDRKAQELEVRAEAGDKGSKIVWDMHNASGLWTAASADGLPMADAEQAVVDFLKGHGVGKGDPMCGSSVHFDRAFLGEQMDEVEKQFGYRNVDVSSIKEICSRLEPELFAKLNKYGPPQRKQHRTIPDLIDTANEFAWYAQEFLMTDKELVFA